MPVKISKRNMSPVASEGSDTKSSKTSGKSRKRGPEQRTETPTRLSKRARAEPKTYKEQSVDPEDAVHNSKGNRNNRENPDGAALATQATKPELADNDQKPAKRPRKSKAEKEAEAMPLAERSAQSVLRIGAHVSAAGGAHMSVPNAIHIGSNAFALFLKSQRKWANPELKEEHAAAFVDSCKQHSYEADSHVLPHGSYLVNLANPDPEKATQAYTSFVDDLRRCERLGIKLYNFHPGNTNGAPRADAIGRLAAQLNKAHSETTRVVTLLENMAAAPTANTIGGKFEDLRDTIALIDDKKRVGVCLDTCHMFAAGYDLRTPDAFRATMEHFDDTVGLEYLRAWHLNDSKGVLGSHRDLHQQIGLGFLGLRAFHNIMNDARFHGLPMILETPIDKKDDKGKAIEDKGVWAREIKLLESMVGMDADGAEFKELEAELAAQGASEREKLQKQFDKKQDEGAKGTKTGGKRKARGNEEEGDGSD